MTNEVNIKVVNNLDGTMTLSNDVKGDPDLHLTEQKGEALLIYLNNNSVNLVTLHGATLKSIRTQAVH